MQDRYHTTSDRQKRQSRHNQDSESKLEQIKREVKSWFTDDDESESDESRGYSNQSDDSYRRQYGRHESSGNYDNPDSDYDRYGSSSRYQREHLGSRQDRSPGRTRNYFDDEDSGNGGIRNKPRGQYGKQGQSDDIWDDSGRQGSGYENRSSRYAGERSNRDYNQEYDRYGNDFYLRDQGERSSGGSRTTPVQYTFAEYWLIPGPYAGTGPKGFQRSSDSLKEQVCERLENDGRIDASEIEVEVENCEVTLKGKVPGRNQKRYAEDCADSVRGVKDVHNRLSVDSGSEWRESDRNLDGSSMKSQGSYSSTGATGTSQAGKKSKS